MERRNIRLIACIAVAAILLRVWPLLLRGGPLAYEVNYDEGIYFAASAHLARGALPYRDIFFVHPPGLLLFLTPITYWANHGHVAAAFAGTRFLATLLGGANTFLAGMIALRAFGPLAGITAALLYATFPEAMSMERGPFLEPLLNFLGLAMAWFWLWPTSGRRQLAAGCLGGMALAVKTWAAAWVFAALAGLLRHRSPHAALRYLAGLAAALAILILPFAMAAPSRFIAQIIGFHLQRGPQGFTDLVPRLWQMNVTNPFTSLLALTGVALVFAGARRHWDQEDMYVGGFFTVVLALSVASFVIAPVYFHRYASFLAPSAAVLGGLGMRWITQQPWMRSPAPVALLLALAVGSQLVADGLTVRRMHHRRQLELARAIQETVPRSASIYSLEPGWLILANRLPDGQEGILGGWPGFQLPAFARAWRKSLSPQTRQQAFTIGWHDSQQFLDSYQFLATGNWSVPERILGWLGREWVQRYPGAGKQGFALWQRR